MTTHLSPEQIRQYRERKLTGAELLAASTHFSTCEACRSQLVAVEGVRETAGAFRQALERSRHEALPDEAEHLAYDEMEAYIDGRLDGTAAARVSEHLGRCRTCKEDFDEIEAFSRSYHAARAQSGLAGRLANVWRSWQPWNMRVLVPAAALGGMLLVLLLRMPAPVEQPAAPAQVATVQPGQTIRDGPHVISIADSGAISGLEALAKPYRDLVEQAVVARQLDAPPLPDLAVQGGELLGSEAAAAAVGELQPAGTVVEPDHPVFTWSGPERASYMVSIYDEAFNEVGRSTWIRANQWTASRPLRRGVRYSWQLTVRLDGTETIVPAPPQPEARFRVLEEEAMNELAAVRATHGSSHLVLAVMYARAGLRDAAEQEIRALAASNPDSAIVSQLAASLKRPAGL